MDNQLRDQIQKERRAGIEATQRLQAKCDRLESMLQQVASAASDYKMGHTYAGFADEFGGLDKLRNELFSAVTAWEQSHDESP